MGSTHLKKYARQKWVHLPQTEVNFFPKKWVSTTNYDWVLDFLVSPPKKSSHAAWSGANLRTPMVWTGCSRDHPKDIYQKLNIASEKKKGWKLNIVSKPWGFRQQFFRRKTCYIVFYSLWLHNQSCPVGNGRTTYKFYKAFGISYSQRSMKKAKILSRNPASSKPKRVFQCLTVDPRISH